MARVHVAYGPDARGRVALAAEVTDPFGRSTKARPAALTLPLARQAGELDAGGVLDVERVLDGVCLSDEGKRVLAEARVEVGPRVPLSAEGREFVYLAEADAKLRRGRLFWLMAMTLSRDLELSNEEREQLSELLAAFADSEPGLRCDGSPRPATTP